MTANRVQLSLHADEMAPDGSDVRLLVRNSGASMAHFTFAASKVSAAVRHRTIDELWFVTNGSGELWLSSDGEAAILPLQAGTSVEIPCGAAFQVRAVETLEIIGVAVPCWPGDDEAEAVDGVWVPG